jgi:hypothetical protein
MIANVDSQLTAAVKQRAATLKLHGLLAHWETIEPSMAAWIVSLMKPSVISGG